MILFAYPPRDDPIGRLADYLDAIDHNIHDAEAQVTRSEGNRLTLLHLHAAFGVVIAPTFALIGRDGMTSSIWVVIRQLPGAPYSLAVVLFAGAVILGVATTVRNLRWEITGLLMLLFWYLIIAVSFGAAVLVWLAEGSRGPTPSFYAPFVYAHLSGVLTIHLRTLRKMLKARRRRTP